MLLRSPRDFGFRQRMIYTAPREDVNKSHVPKRRRAEASLPREAGVESWPLCLRQGLQVPLALLCHARKAEPGTSPAPVTSDASPEQTASTGPVSAAAVPETDGAGELTFLESSFVLDHPTRPDRGLLFHRVVCLLGCSGRHGLPF